MAGSPPGSSNVNCKLQTWPQGCGHVTFCGLRFSMKNLMRKVSNMFADTCTGLWWVKRNDPVGDPMLFPELENCFFSSTVWSKVLHSCLVHEIHYIMTSSHFFTSKYSTTLSKNLETYQKSPKIKTNKPS